MKPTITREEASEWTHRLALALDPFPGSCEELWALLEGFRRELILAMRAASDSNSSLATGCTQDDGSPWPTKWGCGGEKCDDCEP